MRLAQTRTQDEMMVRNQRAVWCTTGKLSCGVFFSNPTSELLQHTFSNPFPSILDLSFFSSSLRTLLTHNIPFASWPTCKLGHPTSFLQAGPPISAPRAAPTITTPLLASAPTPFLLPRRPSARSPSPRLPSLIPMAGSKSQPTRITSSIPIPRARPANGCPHLKS